MDKQRKRKITEAIVEWERGDAEIQGERSRSYIPEWSYVLMDLTTNGPGDIARRAAQATGISIEELKEWAHDIMDRYFNG